MPASKLDAQMSVSEAGATDEAFGPRTCSIAGPMELKQMGVVDSAPSRRSGLPMLSRPALGLLRSASAVTMKFAAAAERDETKSRTDAEGAHDHALQEHEAVAPTDRSRCMCSPSPGEIAGSRTGGAAAVFSATAAAIALPR